MGLASKLPALQIELAALAGAVTYRQLADQLKVAIAVAQQNGVAAVSVQTPTGTAVTYPSINVALMALQTMEDLAARETSIPASAKMRLW